MSTLDDDAWDDLLSFIEERRVIPIVGPELLLVSTDRGPRLLLDWVAEKLAGRLNVNVSELPKPYTLNDVVCWFLAARGRREEAYVRLRSIIKDANFEPPLALRRLQSTLSGVAQNDLNPAEALRIGRHNEQISTTLLNLDPNSFVSANNLGSAHQSLGDALWATGRLHEAIPYYVLSLNDFAKASGAGAGQIILYAYQLTQVVYAQSVVGDTAAVSSTLATCAPFLAKLRQSEPAGSMAPIIFDALCNVAAAQAAYERDDLVAARSTAMEAANRVQASKPARGVQEVQKYVTLFLASNIAGHAEYLLGNYAAAERAQREAIEARKKYLTEAVSDRRDVAEKSTWLALALARQNRHAEATEVIAPVVKFHRELAAKNMGDRWQTLELASALYAEALADPKKGVALLREAAALVDGLPATMRPVHDVRKWRERIHQAQQGTG